MNQLVFVMARDGFEPRGSPLGAAQVAGAAPLQPGGLVEAAATCHVAAEQRQGQRLRALASPRGQKISTATPAPPVRQGRPGPVTHDTRLTARTPEPGPRTRSHPFSVLGLWDKYAPVLYHCSGILGDYQYLGLLSNISVGIWADSVNQRLLLRCIFDVSGAGVHDPQCTTATTTGHIGYPSHRVWKDGAAPSHSPMELYGTVGRTSMEHRRSKVGCIMMRRCIIVFQNPPRSRRYVHARSSTGACMNQA